MKKTFFLLFFTTLFSLFSTCAVFAQTFVFTKTMSLGFSGPEVRELQKVLNKSTDTQIARTGPGSLGNETTYFGPLTQAAVVKFQEKYKGEVLTPAGVAQGTGYVGTFTLKKLNELAVNSQGVTPLPLFQGVDTQTQPAQTSNTPLVAIPRIDSISPSSGVDGTTITIRGSGFSSKNTLVTGWGTLTDIPSVDGKTITVTVNSKIPSQGKALLLPLTYHIYVMADKKVSNESLFVLEKEPGITYISDAERERIKQENKKLLEGEKGGLLSNIIPTAHAQALIPFGGPILEVSYECLNGFIVTVLDPIKGPLELMFYTGGSILFSYYQIYTPGPNTVGNAIPGGICGQPGPNLVVFGAINMVGTSLPG